MNENTIITDLALEKVVRGEKIQNIDGTSLTTDEKKNCLITDITIETDDAAKIIGKPVGRYITLEIRDTDEYMQSHDVSEILSEELLKIIKTPLPKNVLVAGLGNRHIPPDSLGSRTVDRINVTRAISEYAGFESKVQVSAIAPGVMGVTGIETAEILQGICDKIDPDMIIVIDSLCARDIHRIANTVQMTDTGINPGGGLGNNRNVINANVLGRRVICIGVPMVVYARTICHNVMEQLVRKQNIDADESAVQSVMDDIDDDFVNSLVVTPKDIDSLADDIASIIAEGINIALETADLM